MKLGIWPYDGYDLIYSEEVNGKTTSSMTGLNFESLTDVIYAKHCFDSFLTDDLPVGEIKITKHGYSKQTEDDFGREILVPVDEVEMIFYHETLRYVYMINETERTSSVTIDQWGRKAAHETKRTNRKASRSREEGLRSV